MRILRNNDRCHKNKIFKIYQMKYFKVYSAYKWSKYLSEFNHK